MVTHVPPFREASWHQGRISDEEYLPFFSCKAVGDVLLEAMRSYPDRTMEVLCGHTHGSGQVQILSNLVVRTAGTDYYDPLIEAALEV